MSDNKVHDSSQTWEMEEKSKDLSQTDSSSSSEAPSGENRGAWGSQLEFILTLVGYAVGLGNVWRFPYLCFKNGGGAFLIPYILMLIFVGLPVFYMELCFGQFASQGPITIWTVSPIFKGVGYGMLAVSWVVSLYYNVVVVYTLYYLFSSFTSDLPYSTCDNPDWNDEKCILGSDLKVLLQNDTLLNETLEDLNMTSYTEFESPSEQFFYNNVVHLSSGIEDAGNVVWQLALCLMLSWLVIYVVLIKGIGSLGKVVYFVSLFPYVMMTILIIRGATLDGAADGVEFYMKPDLAKLAEPQVWSDAATQIFFSLSACSGGLLAMSSYNNFKNNVYRDSILIPIINCGTSIYAGFAIFTVLGFMANEKGVPVRDVAEAGPGLVFVVYPEALTQMPAPTVWAVLFFLMLLTLGFSTEFSTVESVFTATFDVFPSIRKSKKRTLLFKAVCMAIFYLITLPMLTEGGFYLFSMVDSFVGGLPLLMLGIFEIAALQWVYGFSRFSEDVEMMIGRKPNMYFRICWAVVTPIIMVVMAISTLAVWKPLTMGSYEYPDWSMAIGWLIIVFILIWIPVVAIYEMCANGGWEAIKKMAKPAAEWGPALEENRTGRYATSASGDVTPVYSISKEKPEDYAYENASFRL